MTLDPNNFKTYDLIVFLVILFISYRGYRRGLLMQLWSIASTIIAIFAASHFNETMANTYSLVDMPLIGTVDTIVSRILWFIILLIGVKWILLLLGGIFRASSHGKPTPLSIANHIGGLAVGVLEAGIILTIWISFCQLPIVTNGAAYVESSPWSGIGQIVEQEVMQRANTTAT